MKLKKFILSLSAAIAAVLFSIPAHAAAVAQYSFDGTLNDTAASGGTADNQYTGLIDETMTHDVAVDTAYLAGRVALIPEPSALPLLMGFGALGLLARRARRRQYSKKTQS